MNPRERLLAMGVLAVAVLGVGGFLFHLLLLQPLSDRAATIANLQSEIGTKMDQIHQIEADLPRLERARMLSLPPDQVMARREYENFLTELIHKSEFPLGALTVTARPADSKNTPSILGKGAIYTRLPYSITGHGNMTHLTKFLENFYHSGLLHEIKNLALTRPLTPTQGQDPNELDVNMTVEALIVAGVPNRSQLLPGADNRLLALDFIAAMGQGPVGLATIPHLLGPTGPNGPKVLAEPARDYKVIAQRDVFFGAPPPPVAAEVVDVTRFWYLTDITRDLTEKPHGRRPTEAWLYDRDGPKKTRLRAESGFDAFWIRDEKGETKLRGKVIQITERDVIFKANDNYYSIHLGQNLEEALKAPLKDSELKSLGVVAISGKQRTMAP
jgi:hypothetical protein